MKESKFACIKCGSIHSKWNGQCSECKEWNSIEMTKKSSLQSDKKLEFTTLNSTINLSERMITSYDEFNRVCGGGIVSGSILLIGGDPGIGKSTLLLHLASGMTNDVAYISGEESVEQICLRAKRLGISNSNVHIGAITDVASITTSIVNTNIKLVIIDSIHTMKMNNVDSVPGSVNQIRSCTQEIMNFAKSENITFILVGHVTKDGMIAGPKLLEHMVDAVLYMEHFGSYRLLRSMKNRFGSTSETGIFEMHHTGLKEIKNPSTLFLTEAHEGNGTCIFPSIEGERPILIEVQALVSKTNFQNPRRSVVGWEVNRVNTIIAVLESICQIDLNSHDIYVNMAGGLKISEPAADLAIATALISSKKQAKISRDWIIFGEIGLAGEIRQVTQQARRVTEAINIGFKNIIMPYAKNLDIPVESIKKINIFYVKNMNEFLTQFQKNFVKSNQK
ncbi:DNA repair protein RadA [Candidatus Gromoviella agglomerans]|uniref:DNA repair protein RadA n=1 Tax=Candidatus Gromoviella agglomerans TaxID=2806609 RepID=UPI001E413D62|nr:DNA repair protein RadA [Candidatus Gromoviella agglomerans]UFX98528.1 DNA repair protein RadA [Candidatus Gromoviella agglomerans]